MNFKLKTKSFVKPFCFGCAALIIISLIGTVQISNDIESQNTKEILSEKKEFHFDRLPVELVDLLATIPANIELIIVDPHILTCLSNGQTCEALRFQQSFKLLVRNYTTLTLLLKVSTKRGWKTTSFSHRFGTIYRSATSGAKIDVFITTLTNDPEYWKFPTGTDSFTAVLVPSLSDLQLWGLTNVSLKYPDDIDFFLWQLQRSQFLECNETLATNIEKIRLANGVDRIITEAQFLELVYLRDLLYKRGKDMLLFSGTLLGWYRECDVISHTEDLDVVVLQSDWDSQLQNDLIDDDRLEIIWILGRPNDSLEVSLSAKGFKVDIFVLYHNETHSWISGMSIPTRTKIRWEYPLVNEICSVDLRGHLFHVSCNFMDFITSEAGDNWYIPADKASWSMLSPLNTRMVGNWSESEWPSVYRTFGWTHKLKKFAGL